MIDDTGYSSFNNEYTLEMQEKIITVLLYDKGWATIDGLDIVQPQYFENRYLSNICKWIHEYYKEFKKIPSKLVLEEKAKDYVNRYSLGIQEMNKYMEFLDRICELTDSDDFEFIKQKAVVFVQKAAWKKALEKGSKILETAGNYQEAMEEFRKALSVGSENDLGVDFSELDTDTFLQQLAESYDPKNMIQTGVKGWDDALGGGFVKKNVHIIGAAPGYGKALAINTLVLTPKGWKKAGDVKVGDEFIGRNGKPTKVIGVFPQGKIENYKIIFNDRSETNCSGDHLWTVHDHRSRNKNSERTYTLKQLLEKGLTEKVTETRLASGRKPMLRWSIPLVEPVQFEKKSFIIHPYNLGILIGDGCMSKPGCVCFSNSLKDIEIKEKFESLLPDELFLYWSNKNSVEKDSACPRYNIVKKEKSSHKNLYIEELKRLNLFGKKADGKFIPEEYKFASVEQRIELLRGLLDSDGHIGDGNKSYFASISKQLAEDVCELIQSLGGMAHVVKVERKPRIYTGYREEIYYSVKFILNKINPFYLPRKANKWHPTNRRKLIKEVIKQEDVESVCFMVDAEDELFVIEHYIVTHNSRLMAFLATRCLLNHKKVIFITLELDERETYANIYAAATGFTMKDMLTPEYVMQFKQKVANFKDKYCSDLVVKFYKPDCINADTIHNFIQKVIRHKEEKLGVEWKPDVIIIDYMDKMLPVTKIKGNSYEDKGNVATDCKNLGITFDCPVITGSQLGKYTWNLVGEEVISMNSVAESAAKVHLAHSMTTINANPNEKANGKARLFLAKSRSGSPGKTIYCNWNLGKCLIEETEPWKQEDLTNLVSYNVRDASTSSNKK